MIHMHTHREEYPAIKKETPPFVTTWMGLEGITLSDRSQTEKAKYHMISPYVEFKTNTNNKNLHRKND